MLDIKLKSNRKRIAFTVSVLIIAFLINGTFFLTNKMNSSMEIIVQSDYFQSFSLREEITSNIYNLTEILNYYKSEENILNGHTLFTDEDGLPFEDRIYYEMFEEDYRQEHEDATEEEVFQAYKETPEYDSAKQDKINKDLSVFKAILNHLENSGALYYIKTEDVLMTNAPNMSKADYLNSKVYYVFDEDNAQTSFAEFDPFLHGIHALEHFPQDTLYITYKHDVLESRARVWAFEKGKYKPSIIIMIASMFILAISLFYLVLDYKSEYFPWIKNSMFFDVKLLFLTVFSAALTAFEAEYYRFFGLYLVIPASLIQAFFVMSLFVSIVKHYADKTFIDKMLICQIVIKFFSYIGLILGKLPLMFRMLPTPYKARDLKEIMTGIKNIKEGNLDHVITSKSRGVYKNLASDLNTVTDGLKVAVQNELTSERMRTELISNVSHDIRTPLTSIITYVDLIKRTDDPDKIKEYFEIIDQKSQRLKNLTDDLFEASKVSSGSIVVQLEAIDLQFLLSQCLGELSEQMEESTLEFVINYHHKHKYALVDGNLMFRVIENLMGNIFKYSLPRSRVYINIEEDDDHLMLVFKNISAYPLDVEPHELFERFKRGDDSRTTEGSGLGLSITEKLIGLQEGLPEVQIDGDLFKMIIKLKKAEG